MELILPKTVRSTVMLALMMFARFVHAVIAGIIVFGNVSILLGPEPHSQALSWTVFAICRKQSVVMGGTFSRLQCVNGGLVFLLFLTLQD